MGSGYKGSITMSSLSGDGGLKMYVSCKEQMMTDNAGTLLYEEGTGGNSSSANSSNSNSSNETNTSNSPTGEIGRNVKIGNLEVMTIDLGIMSWVDAKKACADLGDGWRLPTNDELNILFENREKIDDLKNGGSENQGYWSSTEFSRGKALWQYFGEDHKTQNYEHRFSHLSVRAVRGGTPKVRPSTVKIGNLEVKTIDLGKMTWEGAKKACADLGDGWRLPTKDELNILYKNREKYGVVSANWMDENTYWSSEFKCHKAWYMKMRDGDHYKDRKYYDHHLRPVRGGTPIPVSIKPSTPSIVKIGYLEVMTEDFCKMSWDDAKKACTDFGDGWRLPTKDELNVLYENKDKIGGFEIEVYWSSTEFDNAQAWSQEFYSEARQERSFKRYDNSVRAVKGKNILAVRDLTSKEIQEAETPEEKYRRKAAEMEAVKEAKRPEYESKIKASTIATMEPENIIDDAGKIWGTIKIVKKQKDEFIIKTGKSVTMVYSGDWKNITEIISAIIKSIKVINPALAPETVENLKILDFRGDIGQTIRIKVIY